ncbi:MAG: 4-alpha-glucanotransferase [Pyrinomonadaceae bacterium]|nr:4-alpha-glucanotransferase [Pyrinomonadaceae bacterium]
MITSRASGILLHPTSLPGPFGIGDLGPEAYSFVDFLISSGQSVWQLLPVGPTGYGNSPYSSYSAFAGNTLLISPEELVDEKLLQQIDLDGAPVFSEDRIDFEAVQKFKDHLMRKAYRNFKRIDDAVLQNEFAAFCERNASWLNDYALFRALKESRGEAGWADWEPELARRDAAAIASEGVRLREKIEAQQFYQFIFFRQWFALKKYCNERGIKIIGDLPIFVAHDSADVWANPDEFKLDSELRPTVVAGVPPDYFSETGQLWGNPVYNWERMEAQRYSWWLKRMASTLELFDAVRMDHFRGFVAAWEIPAGRETAERGAWVAGPGEKLFREFERTLGELPLIAEDLGVITPEVDALRDAFGFPGMRVLQFGFSGDLENIHLPHNYPENTVAYTGTHDNDTAVGWFDSAGEAKESDEIKVEEQRNAEDVTPEKEFCLEYLKSDGKEIHWDFISAVLASAANSAIVPLQDVLGLGTGARMNLPNSAEGNWSWRYRKHDLTEQLARRLRDASWLHGRGFPDVWGEDNE